MKKTVLLLLFSVLIVNLYAQRSDQKLSSSERAEKVVVALEKEINFSTEERSQIKNIWDVFITNAKQYKQEKNYSQIREEKAERDEKVKQMLSDEDYKTYLRIIEENKPKRSGRRR